ncbi:MAG: YfbU family protein [Terrisporobacter othiniensis]|uniref:YfbU family protein n=1 Tax=Terrisporobacter othiniensis TaxID=1577792 RepID=UPI00290C315D|nr:YfbU family protein [Terrisporobacter othiniensis]MDU6983957.1 YfbU family protein [Terrisporobacter othiniensis]
MQEKRDHKLSRIERLMLSNQYRILEKLYPDEAEYYENNRKAIEEGFELHYDDCFSVLSEDIMTEDECNEVIDILNMYRALTFSNKEEYGIDSYDIKFDGFDLNDEYECKRVVYARYFINDLDRFHELKYGNNYADCNSHCLRMDKYRRMLKIWRSLDKNYKTLTKDEMLKIVNGG